MNNRYSNQEDQITLSGIKVFFVALMRAFFQFLNFVREVVKRRRYLLLIGMLAGLILCAIWYVNKPKLYRSSMTVIFNKLTKKTYAEIIEQLNNLAVTNENAELARVMNLPDSTAKDILYFETTNINNEPLTSDTSGKIYQPFKIVVGLRKRSTPFAIQNALIAYVNNLHYLKKLAETDQLNNTLRLRYAESDLAKLDTLKTEFNHFLATSRVPSTIYTNASNPADIYTQTSLLLAQHDIAERALHNENDAVSLLDGFKQADMPYAKPLWEVLVLFGLLGLLCGFIAGALIEVRQRVL